MKHKKSWKQIFSLIIVILLITLYLLTLLAAIFDRSETKSLFQASLFCTFVIPILLYTYLFIYKLIHKNDK